MLHNTLGLLFMTIQVIIIIVHKMQALIAGQWQETNCGLLCESAPWKLTHDYISGFAVHRRQSSVQ